MSLKKRWFVFPLISISEDLVHHFEKGEADHLFVAIRHFATATIQREYYLKPTGAKYEDLGTYLDT